VMLKHNGMYEIKRYHEEERKKKTMNEISKEE